ncbi:MAG TPA: hypothetical protein VGK20_04955 [Candidatus Binatia bacterium]
MPQIVPAQALDLRALERGQEGSVHEILGVPGGLAALRLARLRLDLFGREHEVVSSSARKLAQDRPHGVVHRHAPQLAAFAERDGEDASGEVHVVPTESELLALAQAGVDREGDQRPVGRLHCFAQLGLLVG